MFLEVTHVNFIFLNRRTQDDPYFAANQTQVTPAPVAVSSDLSAILEAQKNSILAALNSQIKDLRTSLLKAQSELASLMIASEVQYSYVCKKRGNEQQCRLSRGPTQPFSKTLESRNIANAKEELAQGISLLVNRQKIIRASGLIVIRLGKVQELLYLGDDLADNGADAWKIKKAEKRAASRIKALEDKKLKSPSYRVLPTRWILLIIFL